VRSPAAPSHRSLSGGACHRGSVPREADDGRLTARPRADSRNVPQGRTRVRYCGSLPARIAIGGFSDGATYALSLGLINGDLFRRVVAFSPGFVVEGMPRGTPQFFISHGAADPILPIDRCSRLIVSGLRKRGYDVTLHEFDGGHEIPAGIARDGMRWVAGVSPP
jgi:predicted esterase